MSGTKSRPWIRRAFAAAAFGTVLVGASVPANASNMPWWWPFKPKPQPTPEIDAGLARNAAAILLGGLFVLRGRKRLSQLTRLNAVAYRGVVDDGGSDPRPAGG